MQQQHHQQQQSQIGRAFYRANRPGNLNISNINSDDPLSGGNPYATHIDQFMANNNSSLPLQSPSHYMNQQQSQQQQQQTPSYQRPDSSKPLPSPYLNHQPQQQPTTPAYANFSSQTVSSPHYSTHNHTQNGVVASSPSYLAANTTVYNNNNNNSTNNNGHQTPSHSQNQYRKHPPSAHYQMPASASYDTTAAQSYTPNYSPCPSSAQIVNKQPHYFTFDINQNLSGTTTNTNSTGNIPNSPHHVIHQSQSQTSPGHPIASSGANSQNTNLHSQGKHEKLKCDIERINSIHS